jgi:NAD(P)-dependent dehydrogenase (short-subunit alcohol dehydrogenase family)
VGKIVVVNDASTTVTAKAQPIAGAKIGPQGSYIITGGTGGLGRALTRRLIEMGAKFVVLVSRSGGDQSSGSDLSALISWASTNGAKLFVAACDVSEATELDSLLKTLASNDFPDPSGVIHGAMVLQVSIHSNATLL